MASSQSDNNNINNTNSQNHDQDQDHQHQPKQEPVQSSSSTDDNGSPPPAAPTSPSPSPSPAPSYRPPMGYPPSVVYPPPPPPGHYPYPPPGQPVGYHNYNNGYNNAYHYGQVPPPAAPAYYTPQTYRTQPERQVSSFLRGIIGGLVFLLIFTCITSIIMWLIMRPAVPILVVNNFSVSNFNLSSNFTANWDANLSVENPNTKLKLYCDQIEVFIYYGEEDLLATSYASPFFLERKEKRLMQAQVEANNSDQKHAGLGSWVVNEMATEKSRTGNLTFDMKIIVWSTFRSGSWWARHITIRVYCEDLVVTFGSNNSGIGNFSNGQPEDCLVFV